MVTFVDNPTGINVIVANSLLEEPMSAQEFFDAAVGELPAEGDFELWGSNRTRISDIEAVQGYLKNNVLEGVIGQIFVTALDGQTAWSIVFSCPFVNFLDNIHTFNEMLESFQILGKSSA